MAEENSKRPQLTVGALKELLKQYPDETLVHTEGCDCVGPASGVDLDPVDNSIVITRRES